MRAAALLPLFFCAGCLGSFLPAAPASSMGPSDSVPAPSSPSTPNSTPATRPDAGADLAGPTAPSSGAADLSEARPADLGQAPSDLARAGDLAVACDKLQSTAALSSPSGHHNAGAECQSCHAPGNGAPTFYLGGTIYSAATGGSAVAGATLNVVDANNKTVKIVSANNGNFWTTTSLTFPIKVDASLCPNTTPMVAAVAAMAGINGACNNCHNNTMRVHIP